MKWLSRLLDRWPLNNCHKAVALVLLEPTMSVEVVSPEENMGDVMGDLNRRRGLVQGMEDSPMGKIIRVEPRFLWVKCSVMLPTSVLLPKAARPIRWSLKSTLRPHPVLQKKLLAKFNVTESTGKRGETCLRKNLNAPNRT